MESKQEVQLTKTSVSTLSIATILKKVSTIAKELSEFSLDSELEIYAAE